MREKIEKALSEIRPHLQADGGDVELVDVEEGVVKIRLTGACAGCPFRMITLQSGIGKFLRERIPEIKDIILV